jgi:hypothetical protein
MPLFSNTLYVLKLPNKNINSRQDKTRNTIFRHLIKILDTILYCLISTVYWHDVQACTAVSRKCTNIFVLEEKRNKLEFMKRFLYAVRPTLERVTQLPSCWQLAEHTRNVFHCWLSIWGNNVIAGWACAEMLKVEHLSPIEHNED